ncbi:CocE/NonD family hydrolase [Streptomyces sp. NPDC006458]|uniref:CocE/NonD family hydrolase n=1 Tax=Streptomyces sp. NPDC006458 TaxID=3154302 RepID=UPI00339F2015
MHIRTSFPREITHEDLRIPLPDGTLLFARAWRPMTGGPVPALLEYAPDRLTDATAARDAQRHPWYAGHGYASVRVDARGYGNSEGLPADGHPATEAADGADVVRWLAAQPWCDGRVGAFGIFRGGTLSLRIAALAPEPLKAVVAVCSPLDHPDNEPRSLGGSPGAEDLLSRSAAALALVTRPPDPRYVGPAWRDLWLKRLEAVEPFASGRLEREVTGAPWPPDGGRADHAGPSGEPDGSGADGTGADGNGADGNGIRAAVLAVGGWHDPDRDAVLRLMERLPGDRVRGLIGPWCGQYPDRGLPPGPAVGFLQETLRWWDHWLKDTDTGVLDDPPLRAYVVDSHRPATVQAVLPGRWAGEPGWPSPNVTQVTYALQGAPVAVRSPMHTGLDAGRFRPVGHDADLPPDQREEDARSACFEFEVGEETWVLGLPRVRLRLTGEEPLGQVAARLCDVAPDGSSTLVTRGVLSLAAGLPQEPVSFELGATGYAFPPGHRIRLAVSSAYWPWVWPRPGSAAGFALDPAGSTLELPVRSREVREEVGFAEPEQAEPLGVSHPATLDEPRPERLVVRDVAEGEWRLETDPCPDGTRAYPDGLDVTQEALETCAIHADDPLSARTRARWSVRLHRPDLSWDVTVRVRSEIACEGADFVTSDEVVCTEGGEVVFHRTWEKRIPRTVG